MKFRNVWTPEFKPETQNILQLLLENHRKTAIVREFIITTLAELIEALHDEFNTPDQIQKDLALYGIHMTKTAISFAMMSIGMNTCTIPKQEPMLIGFGGLDAVDGSS